MRPASSRLRGRLHGRRFRGLHSLRSLRLASSQPCGQRLRDHVFVATVFLAGVFAADAFATNMYDGVSVTKVCTRMWDLSTVEWAASTATTSKRLREDNKILFMFVSCYFLVLSLLTRVTSNSTHPQGLDNTRSGLDMPCCMALATPVAAANRCHSHCPLPPAAPFLDNTKHGQGGGGCRSPSVQLPSPPLWPKIRFF